MTRAREADQRRLCVFCDIVAGRRPAAVVYEDPMTLAFLDIAPATEGHTLVVPKRHAEDLLTVPVEDATAVMRTAQVVARWIDESLRPDGLTLFQANRAAGGQDVFHLHVHLVPRWTDDHLVRPWSSGPQQDHDLLTHVAKRVCLAQ